MVTPNVSQSLERCGVTTLISSRIVFKHFVMDMVLFQLWIALSGKFTLIYSLMHGLHKTYMKH